MERKEPSLVIYWYDTKEPLTYCELLEMQGTAYIVDLTPSEVLLHTGSTNRKIVIRGITDSAAPPVPLPRSTP